MKAAAHSGSLSRFIVGIDPLAFKPGAKLTRVTLDNGEKGWVETARLRSLLDIAKVVGAARRFDDLVELTAEEARSHREHEIAETLQRSLLPDRIADHVDAVVVLQVQAARIDVGPAGEAVLEIPGRFTVADQHELVHGR